MKNFTITSPEGKTYDVTAPDTATPEEVKSRVKAHVSKKASPEGFSVPPIFQKMGEFASGPGRLTRGIGVGVEELINKKSPLDAAVQAKEAMQPGFQPKQGQNLGSLIGGFFDPYNYLMPGGAEAKGIKGLIQAGALGGLVSGGMTLADQLSQGRVRPKELGINTALGTATGGLAQAMRKAPAALVQNAPDILNFTSQVPKRATEILKSNPQVKLPTRDIAEQEVMGKTSGVMQALKDSYQGANEFFSQAARKAGVKDTSRQMLSSGTIPAAKIPRMLSVVEERVRQLKALAGRSPGALKEWEEGQEQSNILRTLLRIRSSLQRHGWGSGSSATGVPDLNSIQQGGAKGVYKEVNELIEGLPKGKFIRQADAKMSAVKGLYEKLQPMMERPGEAQKFLQDIFEGKGINADENLISLYALEEMSGKPIIQDLFKAMSMSYFSQKLADNQIKRSIAGASPFLISALLRVGGLPFQGAMIASALGVTAAHSPRVQAAAIRGAEKYGPVIAKSAKPTAGAILNIIRNQGLNTEE